MNDDPRPPESHPPTTHPRMGNEVSPEPPETPREWRITLWAIFLATCVAGEAFQGPIRRGLAALIPPPESSHKVLYWVSPHDPSRRFDHPGRDAMGMELVPVFEGREAPAPRRSTR